MSSSCPATLENGGHNDGVEMAIGQAGEGRRSTDNIGPPVTGTCRRATSLLKSSSCSATSKNGGQDRVEMAKQVGRRSAENVDPPATGSRPHGGSGLFQRSNDDNGTLLVVATLITTLSYQVGSNVPGGYWQDDAPGHHVAGEPIMSPSWFGFCASMGLTLALLTCVPPRSRFIRGLFVLSYSTLILSFVTQQAFSIIWVSLLVWVGVIALITSAVNNRTHGHLRRFFDWLCREPVAQTAS